MFISITTLRRWQTTATVPRGPSWGSYYSAYHFSSPWRRHSSRKWYVTILVVEIRCVSSRKGFVLRFQRDSAPLSLCQLESIDQCSKNGSVGNTRIYFPEHPFCSMCWLRACNWNHRLRYQRWPYILAIQRTYRSVNAQGTKRYPAGDVVRGAMVWSFTSGLVEIRAPWSCYLLVLILHCSLLSFSSSDQSSR